MGKASRNKRRDGSDAIAVTTVSAPDQGRSWFLPVVAVILLAGVVGIGVLATQRESSIGVVPDFGDQDGVRPLVGDHFHSAYGVYTCDTFAAPIQNESGPGGIHTHGAGYIHVHPTSVGSTGLNSNLGRFMANAGARLTTTSLTIDEVDVDIEAGGDCGGEPATLQVAYWEDQFSTDDPVILTGSDIPELHLDRDGAALTLAFVPEGTDIPKPPTAAVSYGQ